jgi:hypothetical protein
MRQRLPARVHRHRVRRQQAAQRRGEILGLPARARHRQDGALAGDSGDHERRQRRRTAHGQFRGADRLDGRRYRRITAGNIEQSGQTHAEQRSSWQHN